MRLLRPIALLLTLIPLVAHGAGFYAGEIGSRGIGRAGADVVNPRDGFAMWRNPAALANQKGARIDFEGTLGWLNLTHERTGPFATEGYDEVVGNRRVVVDEHVEVNPTDLGLGPDDDWRIIYEGGNYPSQGTVENRSNGLVMGCNDIIEGGLDGRGHCPIFQGIVTLGERAHQVPGLTLAFGAYGPPTGDYWFWDESMATNPDAPEAERYLDERGLDKRYTGPQRYVLIDRDVLEAFYQFSAAYRLNRLLAVGFGLQAVESGLRMRTAISADTLGTEDPNMDAVINITASQRYIPNGNIGFWSNPFMGLEIGGSYQLPRPIVAQGTVEIDYRAPGLDDFIIDDTDGAATVRFNMPAIGRLGALYRFDPWFDVELAFVWEQWSTWSATVVAVEGVSFTLPGLDPVAFAPVVQPKDYQDSYSVRLGGDFDPLAGFLPDVVTLRGGVFYESSAIPVHTLDVSLIDADKIGVATGLELGYMGLHLKLAYQHTFLADVTVENTWAMALAPVGGVLGYETRTAAANGTYKSSIDLLAVGFGIDVIEMIDFFSAPDVVADDA